MTTPKSQKIIDRVRKLMALTSENGASDAEAKLAMEVAARLMGEHHLTEADLAHEPKDDYKVVDESEFNRFRSFVGTAFFAWEQYLSRFVMDFTGAPCYLDHAKTTVKKNGFVQFDENDEPRKAKSVVFYGVAEDAQMARDLYDEIRMLIASMAVAKWGTVYRGDGAAYAEGFVAGLISQMGEQKALEFKQTGTALILAHRRTDLVEYKKEKAIGWLGKVHGIKLTKGGRPGGSDGGVKARLDGFGDGQKTNVEATRRKKIGV